MSMPQRAVVVGGGLAGLAAATAPAEGRPRHRPRIAAPAGWSCQLIRRQNDRNSDRQLSACRPGMLYRFSAFLPHARTGRFVPDGRFAVFHRAGQHRQSPVSQQPACATSFSVLVCSAELSLVSRSLSNRPRNAGTRALASWGKPIVRLFGLASRAPTNAGCGRAILEPRGGERD